MQAIAAAADLCSPLEGPPRPVRLAVIVRCPYTGQRWTYLHRYAADAERVAARMRAAGYDTTVRRSS